MEITLGTAGIVALITALVQISKGAGLKTSYAPLLAILLGVFYFLAMFELSVASGINGIATGLAAMGLYSVGGKTVFKKIARKK
jgi:hypothetical protein|tara:strand:+ start:7407 stop:7658 length:252 start_codon:yes stop_codon:yes gene_type:complete